MYKSGYVVTILQNNQTIKEQGGKVTLPFGSEYEIRLRNKTRKRAVADAYIDGEIAAKGIVVNANDSIDLERYVKNTGHALLKGARFKFVPLGDSKVEDKSEPENGVLEVRWYPEKEPEPYKPPQVIEIHDRCPWHHHDHGQCPPWCRPRPFLGPQWRNGDAFVGGFVTGGVNLNNTSAEIKADELTFTSNLGAGTPQLSSGEAGATIEGSVSNQSFGTTYIDVDRNNPTILTLHLVGVHLPKPKGLQVGDKPRPSKGKLAVYCSTCGRKRRTGERYCPADGMRLDATSVS